MWTPNRHSLPSDCEDNSPKSKTARNDIVGDKSKNCAYSPLSDASNGTTKTTQLSPLSFGSVSTPTTSPYCSLSLISKTGSDLCIPFCEPDKHIFTPSKELLRPSNYDSVSRYQYRAKHPPFQTSCRKSRSLFLSSQIYALNQVLGMKSLAMPILFVATCSLAAIFTCNARLNQYMSYDLNSSWEAKKTDFRSRPLHYFRRHRLIPKDKKFTNADLHALVSGLRPILRLDKVERHFGKLDWGRGLGIIDSSMYTTEMMSRSSIGRHPRIFNMHSDRKVDPKYNIVNQSVKRYVELYPAVFSDNTQLYGIRSSDDEALSKMELGNTHDLGECVPMKEWQTAYHPSCNEIHAIDMNNLDGSTMGSKISLLGTAGYWRNVWKVDITSKEETLNKKETLVLKTLKYNHNFEHAQYDRDRIDAIAMDRLTASPYVVDIYGFCGRSVLNEFADGPGLAKIVDKSKKQPLKRLKFARDIASGLADVHGMDGSGGNMTIAHMDINPANVVVIDNNLKLNDFNIAVMLKWNRTSSTQCGFPSRYPNPQWRSPEEARESQHLTEKIDVFSMGHIFFRMICGHEPWNKLERGGRPTAKAITEKVKDGILPQIPDKIKQTKDPEIKAILVAMLACYTAEPTKRPSARAIAEFLDKKWKNLSHISKAA